MRSSKTLILASASTIFFFSIGYSQNKILQTAQPFNKTYILQINTHLKSKKNETVSFSIILFCYPNLL